MKYNKNRSTRGIRNYLLVALTLLFVIYFLIASDFFFGEKKCLKGIYKDYALVIQFDEPYYKDNALMKELYSDVFGKVIICGPEADAHSGRFVPDIEYESERGLYGYNCMVLAILKFGNYSGYFYSNYDMALNWWNFQIYNTSKIWVLKHRTELPSTMSSSEYEQCRNYRIFLERMGKRRDELNQLAVRYKLNQRNSHSCQTRVSRFFYLPQQFTKGFAAVGSAAAVNKLTQDTGVPNIMQTLTDSIDYQYISENYVLPKHLAKKTPELWSAYSSRMMIVHPYKLYNKDKSIWNDNKRMLQKYYGAASQWHKKC